MSSMEMIIYLSFVLFAIGKGLTFSAEKLTPSLLTGFCIIKQV